MNLWSAQSAAEATQGQTTGDWIATGVSIDTRTIAPGDLFVALKDIRDGHDFVAQALSKGAAAAMVSRVPKGVDDIQRLLIVDDVLPALERLALSARARTRARVVAVTGSAGKTSTKEMLRDVLGAQGRAHVAEASYNNHWGVPLTLARMPADADYAVIEIGMNHPGEIAPLSRMAQPHVAIITTVAAAHLEAFEDIEGIAREKASIFQGLVPGGMAIMNADLPTSPILREAAKDAGAKIVAFGESARDICLMQVSLSHGKTLVQAQIEGQPLLFKLNSAGRHFAMNALGALATVAALGGDTARAALDIANWQPPSGRGNREIVILDGAEDELSLDLIDDAFNANPSSMAAAFEVLAASNPRDGIGRVSKGRRVAILGDMLELGPEERTLHKGLAKLPGVDAMDVVHCVGPRMRDLWLELPETKRGRQVDSAEELAEQAHQLVDAGDVVLVKGSKGSRVSLVVEAIRKAGGLRDAQKGDA